MEQNFEIMNSICASNRPYPRAITKVASYVAVVVGCMFIAYKGSTCPVTAQVANASAYTAHDKLLWNERDGGKWLDSIEIADIYILKLLDSAVLSLNYIELVKEKRILASIDSLGILIGGNQIDDFSAIMEKVLEEVQSRIRRADWAGRAARISGLPDSLLSANQLFYEAVGLTSQLSNNRLNRPTNYYLVMKKESVEPWKFRMLGLLYVKEQGKPDCKDCDYIVNIQSAIATADLFQQAGIGMLADIVASIDEATIELLNEQRIAQDCYCSGLRWDLFMYQKRRLERAKE